MLEPPQPILTVGKKEITYEIGTYSLYKNGKGVEADTAGPEELVENTNYSTVSAGSELTVAFKYHPSYSEAGIWENE